MESIDPAGLRAFREHTLYRLVLRLSRAETVEMVERIRARGYPDLLPSYPGLLANLDTEGASVTSLAAKAGVTRQAAGQLAREIEARGYVVRRPDPQDGRGVLVSRTARGQRLLEDALAVVTELEDEYARTLGRARFEAMRRSMDALVERVDPRGTLDAR